MGRLHPLEQPPILRDRVYATLEELIIDRTLAPGSRLLEGELAEQLDVSRNPVREALTMLAHSGWVDLRPRIGAVVHTPTAKEVDDFFTVRGALEEESARLAAVKATPGDVADLRGLLADGWVSVAAEDPAGMSTANAAFHARVGRVADNRVLDEVLALMKKRLRWYFSSVATARGAGSWEEHARLIDALDAHDTGAAAQVSRDHTRATAELYRDTAAADPADRT
ncbi:GntR family transcriptional regulator [Euzebya sp.]|uniref:GntR family transcriptional regulator n=1 Tax=Euzebya sp. TaxID=1971409 RepID=UPI003513224D